MMKIHKTRVDHYIYNNYWTFVGIVVNIYYKSITVSLQLDFGLIREFSVWWMCMWESCPPASSIECAAL